MKAIETRLLAARSVEDRGYETPCWVWTRSCYTKGYGQMSFAGKPRGVHRIAAAVWLGFDVDSPLFVLHHCDVPSCFNPEHLYVGTAADNTADMMRRGRNRSETLRGEAHPLHVLSARQVLAIRGASRESISELARAYGVSRTLIRNILNRRTWKHLPESVA